MRSFLAVSTLCLFVLVGCNRGNNLTGDWQASQPGIAGAPVQINFKFNPDQTYAITMGSGQFTTEIDGTYKYDDATKALAMTQTKMKASGKDLNLPPQTTPETATLTWKSGDEISIKLGVSELSLKRK